MGHCTGGNDQDHPQEKEIEKTKWLPEEALQIAEKRKLKAKEKRKDIPIYQLKARRKRKIHPFECRIPKNSKGR